MQTASKQDAGMIDRTTERLVVFEVAGRARGRERARMYRTLSHIEPLVIDAAVGSLEAVGVVSSRGATVHQTAALLRIDALGVICV